ncbi:mandelate racemase [Caballeronia sp. SEWSISQ10-4 2]|uniref:enolase C-terminal domain-like protein n=1 Tax=Caballeronia sp. SEWSISQ10-4 2 TaxID=2937438 RepID=UPI002655596E|nr:enolase C-terminal domain-like protein [Caballeronia sp. SEWSISQ10-4 2]MDN7177259.1 mandelate racemase [Caballeronia sp. SEWSISQ10-4 2]
MMIDTVSVKTGSNMTVMAPIVAAEIFEIETQFVVPYKLAEGTHATTRAILLKFTDGDGVVGWGEADPNVTFTGESPGDAVRVLHDTLVPHVLGQTNPEPGRIDLTLDSLVPRHLSAKGAVTMALLDILGKRLRAPVATLLGGVIHESLPVLWPLSNGTADDDIRVIEEKSVQGFSSFMLKMGASPVADEVKRVAALEARYGSRVKFIADANQGWSLREAREFLDGVRGSNLAFVEQPIQKDDLEGMALLAGGTAFSISADESVVDVAHAAKIAKLGAASIFSIKSSKNGGPLRAQRIAAVAAAFGIRCYMNSMLEFGITQSASLQHAVTISNLVDVGHAFMSTLRLVEDPTDFSSFVRNGTVYFPNRDGLGVQVDEAHVRRMAVSSCALGARG